MAESVAAAVAVPQRSSRQEKEEEGQEVEVKEDRWEVESEGLPPEAAVVGVAAVSPSVSLGGRETGRQG